jgi:hypothetical protein
MCATMMTTREIERPTFDGGASLAQLRLIAVALFAGAAMFALVASFVAPGGWGAGSAGTGGGGSAPLGTTLDRFNILRLVWVGLAVTQLPMLVFIRGIMVNRAATMRRNAPLVDAHDAAARSTLLAFQGWTFIALAIGESLALFAGVIYLLSGNPLDLALVGVGLAAMLVLFPTRSRWEAFQHRVQERAAIVR